MILKALTAITAQYLIFSLVIWDINICHWHWAARLLFIIFSIFTVKSVIDED